MKKKKSDLNCIFFFKHFYYAQEARDMNNNNNKKQMRKKSTKNVEDNNIKYVTIFVNREVPKWNKKHKNTRKENLCHSYLFIQRS